MAFVSPRTIDTLATGSPVAVCAIQFRPTRRRGPHSASMPRSCDDDRVRPQRHPSVAGLMFGVAPDKDAMFESALDGGAFTACTTTTGQDLSLGDHI